MLYFDKHFYLAILIPIYSIGLHNKKNPQFKFADFDLNKKQINLLNICF